MATSSSSENSSQSTFAPLPLRPRGPMEVLDIAVRVFKQYLWVLLGWSALVVLGSTLIAFVPLVTVGQVLFIPLTVGTCVCCLAAAVRGQPVTFNQCWQFTKSRFGAMLGMYFLSAIVAAGCVIVLMIVGGLLVWGMVTVSAGDKTAGLVASVIVGSIGGIGALLLFSCLAIWINFVMIVVCMEDAHRGTTALRRAYDLLRGHWIRVSGLVTLLGLGMLALLAIFCMAGFMLFGIAALGDMFSGRVFDDSRFWGAFSVLGIAYVALRTVWNPVFYLTLTLFYLDLRIRKEALDLEWAAHATTPEIDPREIAAQNTAPQWSNSTPVFDGQQTFQPANTFRTDAISANPMNPNAGSTVDFDRTPLPPTTPASADAWYDSLPSAPTTPLPAVAATAPLSPLAARTICHHCGASVTASFDENGIALCPNCGANLPAPAAL